MEMSFRVRVKRASRGNHNVPGDGLRTCLLGSARDISSSAELGRVAVSRHGPTFPLPPPCPWQQGLGSRIGQLENKLLGRTPQREGVIEVLGTRHLGTGDIFHDVCWKRVRVKVEQVSKQSLSFFWKNQALLSRSETSRLGSLRSFPPPLFSKPFIIVGGDDDQILVGPRTEGFQE